MERDALEQRLAEAEECVALGVYHIANQRVLIAKLELGGHDTAEAIALLKLFDALQVEHVAHRDRLRDELESATKGA